MLVGGGERGSGAMGACISGAVHHKCGAVPGCCSPLSLWKRVRGEEEGFPSIEAVKRQI